MRLDSWWHRRIDSEKLNDPIYLNGGFSIALSILHFDVQVDCGAENFNAAIVDFSGVERSWRFSR